MTPSTIGRTATLGAGRLPRTRELGDVLAVFILGIGGGVVAVHAGYGLPIALIAAFLSGLGGGIVRDLVLGGTPPVTLRTPRLPVTALLAGGLAFALHPQVAAVPSWILTVLNGLALGMLCAGGALRSLELGANQLLAVLLGAVSAVGGGIMRDLLLSREPYAMSCAMWGVSAAAGAAAAVLGHKAGLTRSRALALGVATGLGMWIISNVAGWAAQV